MQYTASTSGDLSGRTALEQLTGETPEISEYLDFTFYDWWWYNDNAGLGETKLVRWLGVSHHVGSLMSYWILTQQGNVILRTTVSRVTNLETQVDSTKSHLQEFDTAITDRLNDDAHIIIEGEKSQPYNWSDHPFDEDSDFVDEFHLVVSNDKIKKANNEFTPDTYDDRYLNMELVVPRGDNPNPQYAKVIKRLRDADSIPIGMANENPILDSHMYEVEYQDGMRASLVANYIAENLFAQVDQEGNRHVLLDEIIDYRVNGHEVKLQDAFITTGTGMRRRRETTIGWELLAQWEDRSTNWISLKDLKESYPVQTAESAVAAKIAMQPAFAWWVLHTLKKRNRIISKVKSKYWLRTHKFGIQIPKSVEEAKHFDQENGDTLWWEAICNKMRNIRPAFEVWEKDVKHIQPGYQQIKCHMIFDVKMGENFRRKARFVAGGHTTETPMSLTDSSVVSRDSVRIILLIGALNRLQVMACDIQNAYLTANCHEKIWTYAGPEFGSEHGQPMIMKKALYGLKSSGAAFRAHLVETFHDIGFKPTKTDPDVWIHLAVKPDGSEYYEYIMCYVDDILSVSLDAKSILRSLQGQFKLKGNKIELLDMYLGAQLGTMQVEGNDRWFMSSQKYVKSAVQNIEEMLQKTGQQLPSKCKTPLAYGYHLELDVTPELKADGLQQYQELIGILQWAVELGRVDILMETSMMSTHLAMPRWGHLEQVHHISGYLKDRPKRKLFFDLQHLELDERSFTTYNWYDFYRDTKEPVPGDMPAPRGQGASTHCFVDSDHAANTVTRCSQTGLLLFVNRAPVIWFSRRQNTVETSTFGSEFIAMKTAVEHIEALRYKLWMFGIPIEGPTNVFCDNEAVFKNISIPDSTLKKKHTSICYHRAREAVAARTMQVAKEGTVTNLSDLFAKPLTGLRRAFLLDRFTY